MSRFGFFLKEALRGLSRSAAPSLAALLTVVLTAITLGVFIPVVQATTGTANEVRGRVVVDVFIKSKATDPQVEELRKGLTAAPNVREVKFISKDDALAAQRKKNPEAFDLLGDTNPLPDVFRVTPEDPDKVGAIVDRLAPRNAEGKREPQLAAIGEIRNREDETDKILSATG
ncbi:MAG: ABC transporter permease, partial [Thermoleophilaceae bacterium]|nr:ABC transporter permease [Thermoleophilaceae bacterium]